jgi:hypothetical protein
MFLPPPDACKFLLEQFGIQRTPATLAKQRVVGGNAPPYRKLNRNIYYSVADLRAWAETALNTRYRTTSDHLPGPSGTTVAAKPHSQARRPRASARDCRRRGQDRPTGDGCGTQRQKLMSTSPPSVGQDARTGEKEAFDE